MSPQDEKSYLMKLASRLPPATHPLLLCFAFEHARNRNNLKLRYPDDSFISEKGDYEVQWITTTRFSTLSPVSGKRTSRTYTADVGSSSLKHRHCLMVTGYVLPIIIDIAIALGFPTMPFCFRINFSGLCWGEFCLLRVRTTCSGSRRFQNLLAVERVTSSSASRSHRVWPI